MKKRFKPDQTHGYIGEKKYKAKAKKAYVEPEWLKEYKEERDKLIDGNKAINN